MDVLFIHQNMPGQFKHLAPTLARDPANRVVFLTRREGVDLPGVRRVTYAPPQAPHPGTHHYLRLQETAVLHGQQTARACVALARDGFRPDLVVAHPGWGEGLFVKDVFPRARLLSYCEFFYSGRGADVGFDPAEPADMDTLCRTRARNAHLLLALEACDHGVSPTEWQKRQHPAPFQSRISVIHDGIDTRLVRPEPAARFALPDGRVLTRTDEIVTYVARNLEPYRGFPSFMRAVPDILRRRLAAHVVIVGGDAVSYGRGAGSGRTWREAMLDEVGPLDAGRVHFVGKLPYGRYLSLLQVSSAHVYLTVPFVLSWSCLEALAAGCVVVGSSTPPVQEVIEDGVNGLLVDFFDPSGLAERVEHVLAQGPALDSVRQRARETVLERYDLVHCLPRQVALVRALAGSAAPASVMGWTPFNGI